MLHGGRPRPGDGALARARRETTGTGVAVQRERRAFSARVSANHDGDLVGEADAERAWVGIGHLGCLASVIKGKAPTIPYLGNLWRDDQATT